MFKYLCKKSQVRTCLERARLTIDARVDQSFWKSYCAISSSLLTLESFFVSIDIALELLLGIFPKLFVVEDEGQVTVDIPDLSAKLLKDAKSVAYSNSVFTIHSRLHRKC